MLSLDVHRMFRKTGKEINITKFQKVEFFLFVCVIQLYIYTLFLKLFSILGYYKILTVVPCAIQ